MRRYPFSGGTFNILPVITRLCKTTEARNKHYLCVCLGVNVFVCVSVVTSEVLKVPCEKETAVCLLKIVSMETRAMGEGKNDMTYLVMRATHTDI